MRKSAQESICKAERIQPAMNDGRLFVSGQLQRSNLSISGSATSPVSARDTFISHQNSDRTTAERLAIILSGYGCPCYVDTFDPNVD